MAFMALFGWIFLPIILLGLLVYTVENALLWAAAHAVWINLAVAVLLALNLLVLALLIRARRRRKREGVEKYRWLLLLATLWEAWVVLLCGLYLVVQPLRFVPEDLGVPFDVEHVCFDEWEIVSCRGALPGYACSQEKTDQYRGLRITYTEDRLISDGQTYELDAETPYDECVVWRDQRVSIPGSGLSTSFEELDITEKRLRRAAVNFRQAPGVRPMGWLFYLLDRDTLILYYDCMFFQAERVEQVPS